MKYNFSYDDVVFQFSSNQTEIKAEHIRYKGNFMSLKDLIETEIELQEEINKNKFETEQDCKNHFYFLGLFQKMQQYLHMAEMAREQGEDFRPFINYNI